MVPEVYSSVTGCSGRISRQRFSNAAGSLRCAASPSSRIRGSSSAMTTRRSSGSSARIGSQRASSAGPSSTTTCAALCNATYLSCSVLSVEYTVEGTAPRCSAARSTSQCSARPDIMISMWVPGARPISARPRESTATSWCSCAHVRVSSRPNVLSAGRSPNAVALRCSSAGMVRSIVAL
ncbi:hypothetical protein BJ971_002176 [Actinoplanes digitatis]|uniref:Uncharacterized protein n=1 Tax=Actinoplanes digitatis TaxID=1868 RepID=A0A7W7HVP7_9ACTN|nr:hypothetical protein [Actinoplanes digitatis]